MIDVCCWCGDSVDALVNVGCWCGDRVPIAWYLSTDGVVIEC